MLSGDMDTHDTDRGITTGTFNIEPGLSRSLYGAESNITHLDALLTVGDGQCGIHGLLGESSSRWKSLCETKIMGECNASNHFNSEVYVA